jgi:hypothetical protein
MGLFLTRRKDAVTDLSVDFEDTDGKFLGGSPLRRGGPLPVQ